LLIDNIYLFILGYLCTIGYITIKAHQQSAQLNHNFNFFTDQGNKTKLEGLKLA